MAILPDTSVWSLLLRRDTPPELPEVAALQTALAGRDIVTTTGLVLQELLQGFSPARSRSVIQERFTRLTFIDPTREDHIGAAELSNTCRRAGVQLHTVDALIARLCIAHDLTLLTTDADFHHAAEHIPLRVWSA